MLLPCLGGTHDCCKHRTCILAPKYVLLVPWSPSAYALQGKDSATAAAEELVAEEAQEAAKAAAKKAKKQKQRAKAPNQQRLSGATPASEPASITRLQNQLDVEPIASSVQGSPSQSRSLGSSPDQGTAGKHPQLQHVTVQAPAMLTAAEDSAMDVQGSASAAAPCGFGADNAAAEAAVVGSREADAIFLDQLFCCPVTKVPLLSTKHQL